MEALQITNNNNYEFHRVYRKIKADKPTQQSATESDNAADDVSSGILGKGGDNWLVGINLCIVLEPSQISHHVPITRVQCKPVQDNNAAQTERIVSSLKCKLKFMRRGGL